MTPEQIAEILALADRCEKATGTDRNLNCAIFATVYPEKFEGSAELYARVDWTRNRADWHWLREIGMPAYTASLDAAMTLVPADTADAAVFWKVGNDGEGGDPSLFKATVLVATGFTSKASHAVADTAALALCAAALRSRTKGNDA